MLLHWAKLSALSRLVGEVRVNPVPVPEGSTYITLQVGVGGESGPLITVVACVPGQPIAEVTFTV